MSKKEYILKLLDKFMNVREPAKGIKLLVESNTIDDLTINQLYNTFSKAVKNIVERWNKEKLERGMVFLEKLKSMEAKAGKEDAQDLKELDSMLQDI